MTKLPIPKSPKGLMYKQTDDDLDYKFLQLHQEEEADANEQAYSRSPIK